MRGPILVLWTAIQLGFRRSGVCLTVTPTGTLHVNSGPSSSVAGGSSSLLRLVRRRFKQTEGIPDELRASPSSSRWYDYSEDEDDDESYESKWRRRRIQSLKTSVELSPLELEDLFEADYLERRLRVEQPNQAFGCVFKLEGCVAAIDVVPTFAAAWAEVAAEFDCAPPDLNAVAYAVQNSMRDEVAIDRVFRWTHDWGVARDMSRRYVDIVSQRFDDLELEPRHGVIQWLESLRSDGVPCAVVTKLPRKMLDNCLHRLGYATYFEDCVVCAEDERDRAEQAFLHAALVLQRQPSRCIVFTDTVPDLIGAHEANMRAVGLIGTHPAYELQIADLVVDDLSELRLPSIRKLFADVDFDPEPQLELDLAPRKRALTKTLDYFEDEDDYY